MANSESIPAFGRRVPDQEYVPRPSAYIVLRDSRERFAVVQTPLGLFLPGGGLRPGETPEEAAAREAAEECGLRVEISTLVGVADQYVYSKPEETFFVKRSTFVRASVTGSVANSEADHTLCWLSAEGAERSLTHESHRWAVAEARRPTPLRSPLSSTPYCRHTSLPRDDRVVAAVNTPGWLSSLAARAAAYRRDPPLRQ